MFKINKANISKKITIAISIFFFSAQVTASTEIAEHMSKLELAKKKYDLELMLQTSPTVENMQQWAETLESASVEDGYESNSEVLTRNTFNAADTSIDNFIEKHFAKGCSQVASDYFNALPETSETKPCAVATEGVNDFSDLDISSITSTSVLTGDNLANAKQTVVNLTQPVWNKMEGDSDQPKLSRIAESLINRAGLSVPLNSYNSMINMRKKIGTIPGNDGGSTDVSEYSLMEGNSIYRVLDQNWSKKLATLPKEAILREMAHMQAIGLYNQFQQYKQAERMEAVMAQVATKFSVLAELLNFDSDAQLEEVKNGIPTTGF